MSEHRRIRLAMIGGGPGSFIGDVHRMAANLDGQFELVAGAFSRDPDKCRRLGHELFLDPERCYGDWKELLRAEAGRPVDQRPDIAVVITPNHLHFPVACAAMEAGFHVISDKPATRNLQEAVELREIVRRTGMLYVLTHNITAYPMVREARRLVADGVLGELRKLVVEYPQGWLHRAVEEEGNPQADWRTDPQRAGAAGAMGDIGTHAENLAEFVSGLQIRELCADLSTFVPGRSLDDDGTVLLRFEGGARGLLHATQIAAGEENDLNLRVWGSEAGLEWRHREPNTLLLKWPHRPNEIFRAGVPFLGEAARAATRLPPGHPEGFLEGFANLYRETAGLVRARLQGREPDGERLVPDIEDGVRGMAFIQAVIESTRQGAVWTPVSCQ